MQNSIFGTQILTANKFHQLRQNFLTHPYIRFQGFLDLHNTLIHLSECFCYLLYTIVIHWTTFLFVFFFLTRMYSVWSTDWSPLKHSHLYHNHRIQSDTNGVCEHGFVSGMSMEQKYSKLRIWSLSVACGNETNVRKIARDAQDC